MQTYQTLAELTASSQTKSGTQLLCRENNGFYILQDSGYVPLPDDITLSNGRVAKFEFFVSAKNIASDNGNVQEDLDELYSQSVASYTTAELAATQFTQTGLRAENSERNNARYVLEEESYTPLQGDIISANGRVWKLIDIYHVESYGAVPDGVTDSTFAVQACFDRLDGITPADQQFYGGVAEFGVGSYLLSLEVEWDRHSIRGQGSFQTAILWNADGGVVFRKNQPNTFMEGIRLQAVNGGVALNQLPDNWINSTATTIDWSYRLFDVYFGKSKGPALLTGQIVNAYLNRVRWDNAECLMEVVGEGGGSVNRVISLKDCTVDFTQLSGINVDVDCLFRFNLGNSDYYTLSLENWRFEGDNEEFGGTEIVQVNDLNAPTQTLRSRPLTVVFKNVGFSFSTSVVKTVDLIGLNTTSTGVNIPIVFDNFYQSGNIIDLFTAASAPALSSLQQNPQLPLTMGSWRLWPNVVPSDSEQTRMSSLHIGDAQLQDSAGNLFSTSILDGDPDAESSISTISSGAVDVSGKSGLVTIDTEGGAATDTLDTINGGVGNQRILLRTVNNSRDVTVSDGTGNIQLDKTNGDVSLTSRGIVLELIYSSQIGAWLEV